MSRSLLAAENIYSGWMSIAQAGINDNSPPYCCQLGWDMPCVATTALKGCSKAKRNSFSLGHKIYKNDFLWNHFIKTQKIHPNLRPQASLRASCKTYKRKDFQILFLWCSECVLPLGTGPPWIHIAAAINIDSLRSYQSRITQPCDKSQNRFLDAAASPVSYPSGSLALGQYFYCYQMLLPS